MLTIVHIRKITYDFPCSAVMVRNYRIAVFRKIVQMAVVISFPVIIWTVIPGPSLVVPLAKIG